MTTAWPTLLAQTTTNGPESIIPVIIVLAIFIIVIAGMWKMFIKAGQPGWAAIIPIVNLYFLCKVAGKPGWWLILMFIPIVGIIIQILVAHGLSKSFGKGLGTTLGLIFLPFIFYPVLGFGDAEYQGPAD